MFYFQIASVPKFISQQQLMFRVLELIQISLSTYSKFSLDWKVQGWQVILFESWAVRLAVFVSLKDF